MTEETKKVGITETMELVNFLTTYMDQLKVYKEDGKLDVAECLAAVAEKHSEAVAAVMGSWNIRAELKDVDQEEKDKLLAASLGVITKIAELVLGVEVEN
jgi:hypothetical protein